MTFFGTNMILVGKDLGIDIAQVKMYVYSKESSITLYESDGLNYFLNIPKEYLANFNASFTIPGRNMYWQTGVEEVTIKEISLKIPLVYEMKDYSKPGHIFEFIEKRYKRYDRKMDFVYSIMLMNGYKDLESFLQKVAIEY